MYLWAKRQLLRNKIIISEGVLRTTRLNSAIELILLNNKELKGQKKRTKSKKIDFVPFSEANGT